MTTITPVKVSEIDQQPCSVAKAISQIGDAWSILILREAFYGRRRFSDFVRYTGAQRTVVSARLKHLVESGILDRIEYSEYPSRHHYLLTTKGRALAPVLFTLAEWGERWLGDDAGRRIELTHDACGHPVDATVVCGHCREPIDADAVTPGIGPGFPSHLPDIFATAGSD